MKHKAILTTIALMLGLVLAALSQTPPGPKHHAVFQMTDPKGDEWDHLLAHVINMRKAFATDGGVEIEVVFFGAGLDMLRKTNIDDAAIFADFATQGVKLAACQNSMRDRNVKTEDLFPFASQVDSGVAELVRKQEAGWAYLK
jgi:intracellular sulfur oxidation DsrE/DsrF family protein